MHAHDQIRIVVGNDHPNPLAFDLSKITPLIRMLSLFSKRVGLNEFCIRAAQLVKLQSISGVLGETHPLSRGQDRSVLPLYTRETPILSSRPSILAAAPLLPS